MGVKHFQNTDRKQANKTKQDSFYSASGQLLETQQSKNHSQQYLYDSNGRLSQKVTETNGFRKTTQQYFWNSENQLTKVITKEDEHIHYQYDGFGRRVLKHNSNTNETTHILWDGNTIAQEVTIKPKGGKEENKEQEEQIVNTTHWYFIPGSFTPLAQQIQSNEASDHLKQNELLGTKTTR